VAVFPIDRVGPASDVGLDTHSGPIDATQLYYRVPLKNTCDGDSGGPALVPRSHVERLAGATSYGDANCTIDGVDARTDAPQIAAFIQPTVDAFEGKDPCRADGTCDESCNTGGRLVDPDCAPNHCGADGMCVISCVDPPDPDCAAVDHCGLDGVCDPTCSPVDADCLPPPPSGGTGGAGGAGGQGSGAGAGGAGGSSLDGGMDAGVVVVHTASHCGCRVAGGERTGHLGWLAGVGGILAARRRRGKGSVRASSRE
jgi:hypothetical protein